MLLITADGKLLPEIDDDDIEVLKKHDAFGFVAREHGKAAHINAHWCKEPGCCWTYETELPHATFNVMEDGETYCRGIVIALSDVAGTGKRPTGRVCK